jgi:hypothetical protein
MRKVWMGFAAMGGILIAGILMLAFGKMTDTAFGLWIGGMTANVFGYSAANVVTKVVTKEQ